MNKTELDAYVGKKVKIEIVYTNGNSLLSKTPFVAESTLFKNEKDSVYYIPYEELGNMYFLAEDVVKIETIEDVI